MDFQKGGKNGKRGQKKPLTEKFPVGFLKFQFCFFKFSTENFLISTIFLPPFAIFAPFFIECIDNIYTHFYETLGILNKIETYLKRKSTVYI